MGPVQYVFLAIGVVIALIGLARGYDKELGNAIVLMLTIALLGFVETNWEQQIAQTAAQVLGVANTSTFLFLFYTTIFVAVVFASYSGVTFSFGGKPITGFAGKLLSLGVGIFTGYLIAGTLWHYANKYGYPLIGVTPLTPAQQSTLELMPQTIFPNPAYWVVPAAVLLILRVRG